MIVDLMISAVTPGWNNDTLSFQESPGDCGTPLCIYASLTLCEGWNYQLLQQSG